MAFFNPLIIMPNFNSDKTTEEIQREELNRSAKIIFDKYGDVCWCFEHGSFYLYNGKIWEKISNIEFSNIISSRFPTFDEMQLRKKNEVIEHYKYFSFIKFNKFNSIDGINFNNGFFDINKIEFVKHDKNHYSTILLPYEYNGKNECPLWERTLFEIFDQDINKIKILQEFFGYCLSRDTSLQKCMILIGEGANGKSLILNVLRMLLGYDNTSIVPLRFINDPTRTSSIEGKLVNICNEISKNVKDFEEDFKKIVDGDYIEVNPKYIQPYKIKPFCKLIFAVNEMPFIDDKTHAFYRRLLILRFDRQFSEEEQNKKLEKELENELSGIFNWALEGYKRLKSKGYFIIDTYMKNAINDLKIENNPMLLWCYENIQEQNGAWILKSDAYKKYYEWCLPNGYKPLGVMKFGKEFLRMYKTITKKDFTVGEEGNRQRAWINLTWIKSFHKKTQDDW